MKEQIITRINQIDIKIRELKRLQKECEPSDLPKNQLNHAKKTQLIRDEIALQREREELEKKLADQ